MSFVDVFVLKGFKVVGVATDVPPTDAAFERWVAPLKEIAGERDPIRSVVVVRAADVEAIVAPSYWLFPGVTPYSRDRFRSRGRQRCRMRTILRGTPTSRA